MAAFLGPATSFILFLAFLLIVGLRNAQKKVFYEDSLEGYIDSKMNNVDSRNTEYVAPKSTIASRSTGVTPRDAHNVTPLTADEDYLWNSLTSSIREDDKKPAREEFDIIHLDGLSKIFKKRKNN